jgi:hypothetical protein
MTLLVVKEYGRALTVSFNSTRETMIGGRIAKGMCGGKDVSG